MNRSHGFTLVELLVALVIGVFILILASQLLQGTNRVSTSSVAMSGGLNHVQQAANIIADDVRRSQFIVASGATPYIGTGAAGAPTQAGASLLAMYTGAIDTSRCFPTTPFEYTVYYVVPRSSVTTGSEWTTVASDSANTTQKVLMQFSACATFPDPSKAVLSDEQVRVISDYLGTATFAYKASATGKPRQITLSLTATQVILGKTSTGRAIDTVATSRNIF